MIDTKKMADRFKDLEEGEIEDAYKIEVPANRYDLLCVEGIAQAIKAYLGIGEQPEYNVVKPENPVKIVVEPETGDVRHVVVGAVLRGIHFTEETFNSFITLQDLLHQNICRRRTLASMGTHDLDKVKGQIRYRALPPEEINFLALKQDNAMNGRELFDSLRKDPDMKLEPYLHIIEDKPRWPIFYDENDQVLSLPPIINSEGTKISVNTTNVFIEITATDAHRANIVLNMLVTQFSAYCEELFTVEPVEIVQPDGTKTMTPNLNNTEFTVNLGYCNRMLGLEITMDQVPDLLKKMGLVAKECRETDFDVIVPPTRPDILHPCDIAEDLGIAFGFNNIPRVLPPTNTEGKLLPLNKYTDLLRQEIA